MVTQVNVMMGPAQPVLTALSPKELEANLPALRVVLRLVLMAVSPPDGYPQRPLYQKHYYLAKKVCEILDNIHQLRIPTQVNVMTAPAPPVLTALNQRECQENHRALRVAPRPALTGAPPPREGRGNVPERRDSAVTGLTSLAKAGGRGVRTDGSRSARRRNVRQDQCLVIIFYRKIIIIGEEKVIPGPFNVFIVFYILFIPIYRAVHLSLFCLLFGYKISFF